jgi:hypothetical protein
MANRLMANRSYTGRKDVKTINAVLTSNGAADPTLDTGKSWGVAQVTRAAAGRWLFKLGLLKDGAVVPDTYRDLIGVNVVGVHPSGGLPNIGSGAVYLDASSTTGQVTLSLLGGASVETDPTSTHKVLVEFVFADGSAP